MQREFALMVFSLLGLISPTGCVSEPAVSTRWLGQNLIAFQSPAAVFSPDSAQLAQRLSLTDRMAHYHTPGVSITVIDHGRIAWSRAYGVADRNTGRAVTAETVFEAASTSKFVTAVLALHLVDQGRIDLDRDVNRYLTSWHVPENEFTREEKVTLRRLLTHQAGLPTTNYSHDASRGYPTLIDVLSASPPAQNKPATPERIPGSEWQYSNIGYNVIELLLSDVTGTPFATLAEEVIFQPLEMSLSTFRYPLTPDRQLDEAKPHDGEGRACEPAMHQTALAHAGLTTTTLDLARFTCQVMAAYRGEPNRLLSPAMARELFSEQVALDPRLYGIPMAEGLGVFLTGGGDDRCFLHPGSNLPGLNCWLIGWLEKDEAILIMTNGAGGELLAMEIITAFALHLS